MLGRKKFFKGDCFMKNCAEKKVSKFKTKSFSQDMTEICKTTLSMYSMLYSLVCSIDKLILTKAQSSMFLPICSDIEECGENIIELSEKKVALINLKVLIDESLNELKDDQVRILLLRYVDGLKCEACMRVLDLNERTYYRKIDKALNSFKKVFCYKLSQNPKISQDIFGKSITNDIYCKVNEFEQRGGNVKKNKDLICNFIIRRLRKMF